MAQSCTNWESSLWDQLLLWDGSRRSVHQLAGDGRLACQLVSDVSMPLQFHRVYSPYQHVHLDAQLVAGLDRLAKLRFFDPGEDHEALVPIGDFGEQQCAGGLRDRFDHEYSRH